MDFSPVKRVLSNPDLEGLYSIVLSQRIYGDIMRFADQYNFRVFNLDNINILDFKQMVRTFAKQLGYNDVYHRHANLDGFLDYMGIEFEQTKGLDSNGIIIIFFGIQQLFELFNMDMGTILDTFGLLTPSSLQTHLPLYVFFALEENQVINDRLQALLDKYEVKDIGKSDEV